MMKLKTTIGVIPKRLNSNVALSHGSAYHPVILTLEARENTANSNLIRSYKNTMRMQISLVGLMDVVVNLVIKLVAARNTQCVLNKLVVHIEGVALKVEHRHTLVNLKQARIA